MELEFTVSTFINATKTFERELHLHNETMHSVAHATVVRYSKMALIHSHCFLGFALSPEL